MRKTHVKVELLKPHERTDRRNLAKILAEVTKDRAVYPLLVDKKTLVVLDGHHRLAILKKMRIEKAPVILVDYFGKDVSVKSWKKGKIITKEEVISRGLAGKLFSPKTSRHTHKFKARRPTRIEYNKKPAKLEYGPEKRMPRRA